MVLQSLPEGNAEMTGAEQKVLVEMTSDEEFEPLAWTSDEESEKLAWPTRRHHYQTRGWGRGANPPRNETDFEMTLDEQNILDLDDMSLANVVAPKTTCGGSTRSSRITPSQRDAFRMARSSANWPQRKQFAPKASFRMPKY